jgi:flagellar biosynthesis protein FlhF
MRIKKYYAKTLNKALQQAKLEFGDGVTILESRQVGSNKFLKRGNNLIEITVAIDNKVKKMENLNTVKNLKQVSKGSQKYLQKQGTSITSRADSYFGRNDTISNEMAVLRHELNKLNRRLRIMTAPDFPEPFSKVLEKLKKTGIADEDAITFIRRAYLKLEKEPKLTQGEIIESVKNEILSIFFQNRSRGKSDEKKLNLGKINKKIKFADYVKSDIFAFFNKNNKLMQEDEKEQKIVAVIGSAGVGKTTILMKMSIHPEIYGKKNVAIVSTDSYRIAATESWKVFSKITSIPFMELKDMQNLRNEIDKMSNMDVILIDMPARSPLFAGYFQELQNNLAIIKPTDIQLVLSATSDLEDLYQSAGLYRTLNPTGIIFTKIDETTRPGKVVSAMREVDLPVSYISYGQSIPTDIRDDVGEFIWEKILELI